MRTHNYREWQQTGLNNHASIYKLNSLSSALLKIHKAKLARKSCCLSFQKEKRKKIQKDCLMKLNFKWLWKLCHHEFFHQQHKHCKFLDFNWLFTSTIFTFYSHFSLVYFSYSFNPTKYASMPDRMITVFFYLSSQSS